MRSGSGRLKGLYRAGLLGFVLSVAPGCGYLEGLCEPGAKTELPPRPSPPPGFRALFDGDDLAGWQGLVGDPPARSAMSAEELERNQAEADLRMRKHWRVIDGYLYFDGRGENLCTAEEFGDFELMVDWKIPPGGDSGIYLRGCPQVQIWDVPEGSGGLYNNIRHPSRPRMRADRPAGEWNSFRIRMVGERVTVWLNGELVVEDVVMENYWEPGGRVPGRGPIELQSHGGPLRFRNVYIMELGGS